MRRDSEHRCFIGVPVAGKMARPLRSLAQQVPGAAGARSVPERNLHLTLVFLGGLTPAQLRAAASVVRSLTVSSVPGSQLLERAGGFPGPDSRVVAVEGRATQALTALVSELRRELAAAGLPDGGDRPFRPHITLAKRPRDGRPLGDLRCRFRLPVEEVVLFESLPVPGDNGVMYRARARRRLTPEA